MSKVNILAMENEEVIAEIEGEMWATSSSPIARIIGFLDRILSWVIGKRKSGHLVLTSNRIIFHKKAVMLWCFPTNTTTDSILPQGCCRVGYTREGTFLGCFCPKFCLKISLMSGEEYLVQMKGVNEKEAGRFMNVMYSALSR